MFGIFRTLLALLVVAQHLGNLLHIGAYAVFGFYILSGYLMTYIVQKNYGYSFNGSIKYATNRFLRIYPLYWASLLLMAAIIFFVGEPASTSYHRALYLPDTASEILHNLFLYFPSGYTPRLTPPSWALTVEIFFYILIGLGLSKNKTIVLVWFVFSALYHLFIMITDGNWADRYFLIQAASLPFSIGALIFFYKDKFRSNIAIITGDNLHIAPVIIFFLILANWYAGYLSGLSQSLCFYSNLILCTLMITILADLKPPAWMPERLDKKIGDLSYPIYLMHYQAGLIAISLAGFSGLELKRHDGGLLAVLSLPIIFILSWILTKAMEEPINRIRARIKNDQKPLS